MGTTATVRLGDHVETDVLLEIMQIMSGVPRRVSPGFGDELEASFEDDELELFHDWDSEVGRGDGFFRYAEDECRTRRVDLRGPTDLDPGPLPMGELDPEITGELVLLTLP